MTTPTAWSSLTSLPRWAEAGTSSHPFRDKRLPPNAPSTPNPHPSPPSDQARWRVAGGVLWREARRVPARHQRKGDGLLQLRASLSQSLSHRHGLLWRLHQVSGPVCTSWQNTEERLLRRSGKPSGPHTRAHLGPFSPMTPTLAPEQLLLPKATRPLSAPGALEHG